MEKRCLSSSVLVFSNNLYAISTLVYLWCRSHKVDLRAKWRCVDQTVSWSLLSTLTVGMFTAGGRTITIDLNAKC